MIKGRLPIRLKLHKIEQIKLYISYQNLINMNRIIKKNSTNRTTLIIKCTTWFQINLLILFQYQIKTRVDYKSNPGLKFIFCLTLIYKNTKVTKWSFPCVRPKRGWPVKKSGQDLPCVYRVTYWSFPYFILIHEVPKPYNFHKRNFICVSFCPKSGRPAKKEEKRMEYDICSSHDLLRGVKEETNIAFSYIICKMEWKMTPIHAKIWTEIRKLQKKTL